jgi:hypothetical protein
VILWLKTTKSKHQASRKIQTPISKSALHAARSALMPIISFEEQQRAAGLDDR